MSDRTDEVQHKTEKERAGASTGSDAESEDAEVNSSLRRMSRRSFLWAGAALAAGYSGWRWLVTRGDAAGIPWPLRRTLEFNEKISRGLFSKGRLAATFPVSSAEEPRPNGDIGLGEDFDATGWQLSVEGLADGAQPLILTMADIKALPRVEMTTELKCIEGWSQVVHWTGARLADLMAKYPPATRSGNPPSMKEKPDELLPYVALATPDGEYYVGLEMESALHPQTLLCYDMNGRPLTTEHGAPLRLAIPVKYGIKHIKRIGTIRYSALRPPDYWAEQGYDWYAGH